MTEKLYEQDAYLREFDAAVSAFGKDKDRSFVVLTRSAFYPEGGGQPGDWGALFFEGEDGGLRRAAVLDTHEKDGEIMRAVARQTPEAYQALRSGDDVGKALAAMEMEKVEDLTAGMPKQQELDRLVGKTGGELLNDGWEIVGHSIYSDFDSATEFYLVKGLYFYSVRFDEAVEVDENFSEAEAMRPLTIASVTCDGVSDHCIDLNYSEK